MSDLQTIARSIFLETLKALDLPALIARRVRSERNILSIDDASFDLDRFSEVLLIGIGKASLPMGRAFESLLGDRLTRGLLVTNRREPIPLKSEVVLAGHPVPNQGSVFAARRAIELVTRCPHDGLVIFLISGGGSSLFEMPVSSRVTIDDLVQLNRALVECGATIEEMNLVRKRFSAVKGGKLGALLNAGEAIAFYASDVNSGDLKSLASNPLLPEEESLERFIAIIEKYKLEQQLPGNLQGLLEPQAINPDFSQNAPQTKILPVLLADNREVVREAARIAEARGFVTWVDLPDNEDSIDKTAERMASEAIRLTVENPWRSVCVISGGEVSCPVKGPGFGGRNQEFVLRCAALIGERHKGESCVLSCGTDGIDGRSIAAGAALDAAALTSDAEGRRAAEQYLAASDSGSFFAGWGGAIVTGPSGNNLRDLRILLLRGIAIRVR